jgi:ATP-binding cassette, subfamily B (MDR/TAP), member 10
VSPDPSMAGALPPGAWWENVNTNTAMPIDRQPYGPDAGDAAVQAARAGNLRLQNVSFAYPLRPNSGGEGVLWMSPGTRFCWSRPCMHTLL